MQHQVATAPVRRTTDACDSCVQRDDPWSSHRPSTLKGTWTSRLWYDTKASNTVVNSTDSIFATNKGAMRRFTQAVAELIMAGLEKLQARLDEINTELDGTKKDVSDRKGHDDAVGCLSVAEAEKLIEESAQATGKLLSQWFGEESGARSESL